MQPRDKCHAILGGYRPAKNRRDGPYRNAGRHNEHRDVDEAPEAALEVLPHQVDKSRHQREARNKEQQRRNEASLVRRLDTQKLLRRCNEKNVDHCGESAASHPDTEVVHVADQHLST